MQQELRLCVHCSAPLQPGAGYCGYCGKAQAANQSKKPPAYAEYSEDYQQPTGQSQAFQSPTGFGAAVIPPGQHQPVYAAQPMMVPFLLKQRTSAFAVTALVLGIVGITLAVFDLIINVWVAASATFERPQGSITLFVLLLLTSISWTPTLLAFILGLIGRGRIHRDGEQTQGLSFAHAGIILGAVGLCLPLLGILLYLLILIP